MDVKKIIDRAAEAEVAKNKKQMNNGKVQSYVDFVSKSCMFYSFVNKHTRQVWAKIILALLCSLPRSIKSISFFVVYNASFNWLNLSKVWFYLSLKNKNISLQVWKLKTQHFYCFILKWSN